MSLRTEFRRQGQGFFVKRQDLDAGAVAVPTAGVRGHQEAEGPALSRKNFLKRIMMFTTFARDTEIRRALAAGTSTGNTLSR